MAYYYLDPSFHGISIHCSLMLLQLLTFPLNVSPGCVGLYVGARGPCLLGCMCRDVPSIRLGPLSFCHVYSDGSAVIACLEIFVMCNKNQTFRCVKAT